MLFEAYMMMESGKHEDALTHVEQHQHDIMDVLGMCEAKGTEERDVL